MKKTEALKELFKINLEKIKGYTHMDELSIAFDEDGFIVINSNNEVVYKNKFSNYDLTYTGQVKFVLDVVESVTSVAMVLEQLRPEDEYFLDDYINTDGEYFIEIEGSGFLYEPNYSIEVDLKRFVSSDDDTKICEIYEKYKKELLSRKYILEKGLEFNSFIIYLLAVDEQHRLAVYIGKNMHNRPMCLGFVENLKRFEDPNNPENLIVDNVRCALDYEIITLFYSLTTDKELKEAVETVKKNLEEFSKEFAEKLKRNEI